MDIKNTAPATSPALDLIAQLRALAEELTTSERRWMSDHELSIDTGRLDAGQRLLAILDGK